MFFCYAEGDYSARIVCPNTTAPRIRRWIAAELARADCAMGGTTIVQCQSAAARSPDPGMGHSGPMLGLDYLGFEEAAIRSPVLRQPADGLRLEGGPARCGPASAATKQRGRRGGDSGRLIEQRSRPRSFQGRGLLRAYRGAWAEYTNRSPDESTTNRRRNQKKDYRPIT